MKVLRFLLALLLLAPFSAPAETYKIDSAHSQIAFSLHQFVSSVRAEFFDAAKLPEITFKSRSVKRTGESSGNIIGDFTMHGVTKPMTLHVKLSTPPSGESLPERTRWIVTADPINRKDFGLMFSSATESISGISSSVTPTIEIEAVRAK